MSVKDKIIAKHSNDEEHLKFIFSDEKRIVVTAPAGCGKTTAMVSKLAWELKKNNLPDHKKVLAMSFSINAATKIKDSLNEMLPELVDNEKNLLNKVEISNYHNFAIKLLYKYGYNLNSELVELPEFKIIDDTNPILTEILTSNEFDCINDLNKKINNLELENIDDKLEEYYKIFNEKLFKKRIITYNAILVSAYKLLCITTIRKFYSKYYKMIIVDEFQDTNYLSYLLINQLIDENNKLILIGDDVQKIYGFLGALPNILKTLEEKHKMKKIEFVNNYRFKDNPKMKELDKFIRTYNILHNNNNLNATINVKKLNNENNENTFIVNGINKIIETTDSNIAILVRSNFMANSLLESLNNSNINYFNALFGDRDKEYIKFHEIALEIFYKQTEKKERITNVIMKKCMDELLNRKNECCSDVNKEYIFNSLYELINILFKKSSSFGNTIKERYEKIIFILTSNGLKRMLEFLENRVILTTIHSAKGLEWDYVIIPRMMAYNFPASSAMCKKCNAFNSKIDGFDFCKFNFDSKLINDFEDEISIFYVAITRAKKDLFVTLNNGPNKWGYPQKTCCFLQLEGLSQKDYEWEGVINSSN